MPYADPEKQRAYFKRYKASEKGREVRLKSDEKRIEKHRLESAAYYRSNIDQVRAAGRRYYAKNKNAIRRNSTEYRLREKYGLTAEDLARMYEAQNGRCPGCIRPLVFDKSTHIDHNHRTERVRGLLCRECNIALGLVHEDLHVLFRLIEYLDRNDFDDAFDPSDPNEGLDEAADEAMFQ